MNFKALPRLCKSLVMISAIGFILQMTCLTALLAHTVHSQAISVKEMPISLEVHDQNLGEFLHRIEEQTGLNFVYQKSLVASQSAHSGSYSQVPLYDVLLELSATYDLAFKRVDDVVNIKKRASSKIPVEEIISDRIITGKVTDETASPLTGATVQVKGNFRIGTVTDIDGRYTLSIPDDATTLVFSYIGFLPQEIDVSSLSVVDVVLQPDLRELSEITVVSTGYYEVEQRLNPGNIVKLDAATIEQQPISNPLQALQGRLTGVNIIQNSGVPGSSFQIEIRGQNSLRPDGNEPLYLVNGVPYPASSLLSNQGSRSIRGGINPLNFINPNDIERIEILKDADATAIYGSRGANGVIRITTKQGRTDKLRVTYNGSMGVGTVENKLDLLNTEQYLTMRREAFVNDGATPGPGDVDVNGTWSEDRDTDWQEELLGGEANFSNHQLSFSGGSGNTNFLVGLNYTRQSTIYSDDLFDRKISGNVNLNHSSIDNRFNINLSGNVTSNMNLLSTADFASDALGFAPNAPALRNEDGSLNWEGGSFNNPLAALIPESETKTINLNSSLSISYEVLDGVNVKSVVGYSALKSDFFGSRPITALNPFQDVDVFTGTASFGTSSVSTWTVEPQLEYKKIISKHEITALVGTTFQETVSDRESFRATGFTSDALLRNPLAAAEIDLSSIDNREYRFSSVYGRLNYLFDEKYIVNLTGRRDGSSRFGPGRQFANFGAIGIGWIFSEESFFIDNVSFLSFGKLRGSYGVTGSDAIGDYQFLELWNPMNHGYDGAQGLTPNNLFNEDFAWEETTKAEVGLELGFFNDRVFLNTSYFENNSSNQLVGLPLPAITGFQSVQSNFPAEVENTGFEIDLSTVNIDGGDFRWTSSFNISFLRNEVVAFEGLEESSFANEVEVGEPLSVLFRWDYTGVDPETGLATFAIPGGGEFVTAPDDFLPFGDRVQDFFGGLQNAISYKGLSLDFHFRFVRQMGFDPIVYFAVPGDFSNQPTFVMDRWQNPGDVTDTPRFTQTGFSRNINFRVRSSDQAFTDASFVRLQNARLSYQFPASLISRYKLENVTVFLQGQNLLTITNYRGWDPETQSSSLPPLRIITAGLTVSL